ncbi:acylphosphatase [Sporolactobacillus shoreae]|uniref:acylphosphatase n=1 Tax=Sporolactobacillus shoreae TaxID=1465501 RepID=A0A4Z0GRR9_9BACL|nr:acylphosphatase [Sporolactobacillus shoreae]TGA99550.1 acylphosphatase [Sporolactobacillus shoreae]
MEKDSTIKSVHIMVKGRVQAVGFRFYTWQTAQKLDLSGWVRNREDGSVEIAAEGPADRVDRFVGAIKKGSPFSHVDHLDMHVYDHAKRYTSFEILDSV